MRACTGVSRRDGDTVVVDGRQVDGGDTYLHDELERVSVREEEIERE
jgi:hypothetical protein